LLFDPDEIQDVATFEEPHQLSEGFDWVMVNGKVVREAGIFNGNRNGRVLKRK
jgi:N-acyl-D-aspartate/D-glutamate deacylase